MNYTIRPTRPEDGTVIGTAGLQVFPKPRLRPPFNLN